MLLWKKDYYRLYKVIELLCVTCFCKMKNLKLFQKNLKKFENFKTFLICYSSI